VPSQYDFYAIDSEFFEAPLSEKYAIAFYHAVMVLVGNEINPKSPFNIMLVSFLYLTGALILANIFANVTVIIQNLNSKEKKF